MAAPAGAVKPRLNVRVLAGRSSSVAVAVKLYATISGIVTVAGTSASTGATLTSSTVMVIDCVSVNEPSLTITSKV